MCVCTEASGRERASAPVLLANRQPAWLPTRLPILQPRSCDDLCCAHALNAHRPRAPQSDDDEEDGPQPPVGVGGQRTASTKGDMDGTEWAEKYGGAWQRFLAESLKRCECDNPRTSISHRAKVLINGCEAHQSCGPAASMTGGAARITCEDNLFTKRALWVDIAHTS